MKPNSQKPVDFVRFWILLGIPVISILSGPLHFLYEWSGKPTIVGILTPVNESIWEHLKLTFWPMLIWWLAGYFVFRKKKEICTAKWFVSSTIAQLVCLLVIVSFYYTYTGALGIESLILDIFSLILGVTVGHLLALHVYRYARANRWHLYFSLIILLLLAAVFIIFTFAPPQIPLFKDSLTGKYGI